MTPQIAALDALVAYFLEAVGGQLRVIRGWPERDELAVDIQPVLAIHQVGRPRWSFDRPEQRGDGTVLGQEATYRCAYGEGVATYQLSLFAGYQAVRDERADLVNQALNNLFPQSAGLILESGYFGQPVRFDLITVSELDDSMGAALGEWRAVWVVSASLELIIETTYPLHGVQGGEVLMEVL